MPQGTILILFLYFLIYLEMKIGPVRFSLVSTFSCSFRPKNISLITSLFLVDPINAALKTQ